MSQTVSVPVNPAVMRWARESFGVSVEDAARRVDRQAEELVAWESGSTRPTIGPLRELAALYRRPLAAFLLPAVPKDPPPPADFRVVAGANRYDLSPVIRMALNHAMELRTIAASLERETTANTTTAQAVLNENSTPPATAATDARERLGVSMEMQSGWASTNAALNGWRATLDRQGVLVFFMTLPLDELRGFSLSGGAAPPVIVLNSADSEAGRIFTLFHEWGHVLMGTGGICLPQLGPGRRVAGHERYCNEFSGALLVPADELRALDSAREFGTSAALPDDKAISAVAGHFRVSKQVLWYRLRDTDLIDATRFAAKWGLWSRQTPPARKKGGGGLRPAPKALNRNGRRFTGLVLDARGDHVITTNDALDYLSVRLKDLEELEVLAGRRRGG